MQVADSFLRRTGNFPTALRHHPGLCRKILFENNIPGQRGRPAIDHEIVGAILSAFMLVGKNNEAVLARIEMDHRSFINLTLDNAIE